MKSGLEVRPMVWFSEESPVFFMKLVGGLTVTYVGPWIR